MLLFLRELAGYLDIHMPFTKQIKPKALRLGPPLMQNPEQGKAWASQKLHRESRLCRAWRLEMVIGCGRTHAHVERGGCEG